MMGYIRKIISWLILATAPLFVSAQSGSKAYDLMLSSLYSNTVKTVTCEEMKAMGNVVVLDTREKKENEVSHIEGARWVGYDTFSKGMVAGISKSDTVIVYCSVGYRSEKIGEQLLAMGFTHVYNLYGGIFQWVNEGNKVCDETNNETSKVHAYSKTWGIWLNKGEKVYK